MTFSLIILWIIQLPLVLIALSTINIPNHHMVLTTRKLSKTKITIKIPFSRNKQIISIKMVVSLVIINSNSSRNSSTINLVGTITLLLSNPRIATNKLKIPKHHIHIIRKISRIEKGLEERVWNPSSTDMKDKIIIPIFMIEKTNFFWKIFFIHKFLNISF